MLRVVCRYEDMFDETFTSMMRTSETLSGSKIESLQRFVGEGKVRCMKSIDPVFSNQRESNAFEGNKM